MKWVTPPCSCAVHWRRPSPATSCMSIAATTSWAYNKSCRRRLGNPEKSKAPVAKAGGHHRMNDTEPRNPFYLLLLAVSFLFVITALAYAVVPTLEDKAKQAGE